jgi:hypothetical protein
MSLPTWHSCRVAEAPDPEQEEAAYARRVASREINGRRVNEAIIRGRQTNEATTFVCECGRLGCNTTLTLSLDDYEKARTDFESFVLVAGHELPDVERVVDRGDGYVIVVKEGEAAEMAREATEPADGG